MPRIAELSGALAAAIFLLTGCTKAPSLMQAKGVAPTDLPTIRMYEGFDGKQENLCTITISTAPYWIQGEVDKEFGCDNDEIRSMKIHNLPAGSYVTLYNDPKCGDHDDWQRTIITRSRPGAQDIIVSGFTSTGDYVGPGENPIEYTLKYKSSGSKHGASPRYNLAGEVSCMNVYVPAQ